MRNDAQCTNGNMTRTVSLALGSSAERLARLPNVVVTAPTWHAQGGGCC